MCPVFTTTLGFIVMFGRLWRENGRVRGHSSNPNFPARCVTKWWRAGPLSNGNHLTSFAGDRKARASVFKLNANSAFQLQSQMLRPSTLQRALSCSPSALKPAGSDGYSTTAFGSKWVLSMTFFMDLTDVAGSIPSELLSTVWFPAEKYWLLNWNLQGLTNCLDAAKKYFT